MCLHAGKVKGGERKDEAGRDVFKILAGKAEVYKKGEWGWTKGGKGKGVFPEWGTQRWSPTYPRRSLSSPRHQSESFSRKCIQSPFRLLFCPYLHEQAFTFYMTVIVCSYGRGSRPVSFSGSDCLPCLSLYRSIPRRIGTGEGETRYSPSASGPSLSRRGSRMPQDCVATHG